MNPELRGWAIFWAQYGPFAQMRIICKNLLINLVPFIHAYPHSKNQIIKKSDYQSNSEIPSHWPRAGFGHNLRTRFFPSVHFSQNVNGP